MHCELGSPVSTSQDGYKASRGTVAGAYINAQGNWDELSPSLCTSPSLCVLCMTPPFRTPSLQHFPCCSQTVQASARTTRDQELGQRAAHLYPEGPQNLPLSSLKVFAFPSPSRIFIDPKGHTRAQLKLKSLEFLGKKKPTLVPGAFPRPRCPTPLACLLPGEGFSYFPSRETCRSHITT